MISCIMEFICTHFLEDGEHRSVSLDHKQAMGLPKMEAIAGFGSYVHPPHYPICKTEMAGLALKCQR